MTLAEHFREEGYWLSWEESYRIGFEEGYRLGFEDGRWLGREEVLQQVVPRMHAEGLAFAAIGRYCAISIEEVARLVRGEIT